MTYLDTQIIHDLYSTEASNSKWVNILDRLHPIVNAKSAGLIVVDKYSNSPNAPNQFGAASSSLNAEELEFYNRMFAKYEHDMVEVANATPVGEKIIDPAFLDIDTISKRPDVAFSIEHFGVRDRFGIRLNDDQPWHDAIAFQYDISRGNVTDEEFSRIAQYVPHIALSVSQGRIFEEIRKKHGAVLSMLDRVNVGMLLLRRDGTVVISNQCSKEIIERSSKIKITRRILNAAEPIDNRRLLNAVKTVANTLNNRGKTTKINILLGSPVEENDLLIELSPLNDKNGDVENSFLGVVALIIDPNVPTPINENGLRAVYNLTSAELDVTKYIGEGYNNREVADIRNTSPETKKAQLKALFSKTNSKSRVGLIRRMISLYLPFRD